MNHNPLVTEIRKKRAEILDSSQGDYHTMMNAMKHSQWESGHEVVNLATKDRKSTSSVKPTRRKTRNSRGNQPNLATTCSQIHHMKAHEQNQTN